MGYILMVLKASFTSLLRVSQQEYSKRTHGVKNGLSIYMLFTCVIAMLFFAILEKGRIVPNVPTLIFACVMAGLAIPSNIVSIKALKHTDVISYSIFLCRRRNYCSCAL